VNQPTVLLADPKGVCNPKRSGLNELQGPETALHPQPSLRISATPANREYLRALRAAESAAWEAGRDLRRYIWFFTG